MGYVCVSWKLRESPSSLPMPAHPLQSQPLLLLMTCFDPAEIFTIVEFLLSTNWTFHNMELLGMYMHMYIHDRKQLLKVLEALWHASKPSNMDYALSKQHEKFRIRTASVLNEILLWVLVVEMASLLHLGWLAQFQMRRYIYLFKIIVCFGMGMEWLVYSVSITLVNIWCWKHSLIHQKSAKLWFSNSFWI